MGDTWITSLEHILDESGAITAPKGPGRKLTEHIVAIVAMASKPEMVPPKESDREKLPEYGESSF